MNSEEAFLRAALPESRVLLNQRLLPYSVGHEILLRRLRSPFVASTTILREEMAGKLFTAVFVCCQDYDTAAAGLNDPNLPQTFAAWRRRCGNFDALELSKVFVQYIADGRSCPEFRSTRPPSSSGGAPFLLMLLNVLQGKLGFSRSEALNCPLGEARWRYCAYYESEGALRIQNDTFARLREAMRARGYAPATVSGS